MNILHLSSALSWRGGEQQIAYLINELAHFDCHQWVLCAKTSLFEKHCQQQQISHYTYNKVFASNPFVGYRIRQIIKKEQIDLIHIHDAHAHTFAYIATILWGIKTPLIVSRRVDFPIKSSGFSNWKYNHPAVKAILCVSGFIKIVIQPDILHPNKSHVVHSGIDLQKFTSNSQGILRKEFDVPKDKLLIANIAAIAPHKDYFTFVDTVDILVKEKINAVFLIIGSDGGEKNAIEAYIQQKDLSQHIILTGFRNDIPAILPEIDILLFTSQTEGLGTSLLDTMACNVPIVSTNAGGIPEIVEDKVSGLVAPIKNPKILAQHVFTLIKNQSLRAKLLENAQLKVQQFSKEHTAKKTWEIYQQVKALT